MKVAVQRTAQGTHFKARKINPVVQEGAVLVGSMAFAILGSAGVIVTASSVISSGTSALTSSNHVLATVGTDVDGEAPIQDRPKGSAGSDGTGTGAESNPSGESDPDATATSDDTDDKGASSDTKTPDATNDEDTKDAPSVAPVDESATGATSGEAESVRTESVVHIIKRGETLCDISRAYGVSVDAIANANGIRDVNVIYADSALVIPAQ